MASVSSSSVSGFALNPWKAQLHHSREHFPTDGLPCSTTFPHRPGQPRWCLRFLLIERCMSFEVEKKRIEITLPIVCMLFLRNRISKAGFFKRKILGNLNTCRNQLNTTKNTCRISLSFFKENWYIFANYAVCSLVIHS